MGGTILVVCILVLIVVGAVISSAKHFKGEGGCCGGGGSVKVRGDKIKDVDRKSTRLNSSHSRKSRMPSSA